MFGFTFGNTIASTSVLQVKFEIKKNTFIYYLQGEFTVTDSKIAMNAIFDSITTYNSVVFNCKKLEFIDTYTMRKILELYEKLHTAGYSIVFCNISPGVKGVMRSNGILDIITHYPNERTGLRAIEKNDFSEALPVYASEMKTIRYLDK